MKTICLDAYKNLYIEGRQGNLSISPCCLITTRPVDKIDFYNNSYLVETRKIWNLEKFPDTCSACKQSEEQTGQSRRLSSNTWYEQNGIFDESIELVRIDYWTGDLCNLRCAICGPKFSSAWKEELGLPLEQKKVVVNDTWKNLNLSTIKYIHFNGGEPLLSKEHVQFLQSIPDKTKVKLFYNTNVTILPKDGLLELWSQFNLAQIDFSIDDLGDRFEYQRFPAKWNDIVKNLQYFRDNCPVNCIFGINTSLGILNYHNYKNLLAWLKSNFSTNRVTDPVEYRTQQTFGILRMDNVNQRKTQIVEYLNKLDLSRGTNWKITFPELVQIL